LADLYSKEPPIVHRDLKPANILVYHRNEYGIQVKLTDFGLSQEKRDLTTICGTLRYLAPEVYEEAATRRARHSKRGSYTPAVDIWSLGVVVFEYAFDLPSRGSADVHWSRSIVRRLRKSLKREPPYLKQFFPATMVIMEPASRFSAHDCYDRLHDDPADEILALASDADEVD
jgi:serine/threonine protein kinase